MKSKKKQSNSNQLAMYAKEKDVKQQEKNPKRFMRGMKHIKHIKHKSLTSAKINKM